MRWLAILAVHFYRRALREVVPSLRRRRCLFEESCSTYALRVLRERGFLAGVRLARERVRSCSLPSGASFVLDEQGRARLLSARSTGGQPVPPRALQHLAAQAEQPALAALPAPSAPSAPSARPAPSAPSAPSAPPARRGELP